MRAICVLCATVLLAGCADMTPAQERFAQACLDAAMKVVACQLQKSH